MKPILFGTPMVQAILEGRKTMTRRVIKPQPPEWINEFGYTCFTPKGHISGRGNYKEEGPAEKFFKLPYGNPGDHLWVRETYMFSSPGSPSKKMSRPIIYKTDEDAKEWEAYFKWKPSIHMPRWASRITLEITNVRAERLQDISEEDAQAEGCNSYYIKDEDGIKDEIDSPVDNFAQLWNSINGKKHPWESNPWVWVIEFKRVED